VLKEMRRSIMMILRFTVAAAFAALLIGATPQAWAQERYDGKEPLERFNVRVGGYVQLQHESTIRVDSIELGLGAVIELEEQLDVDDSASAARIDGFYRFNPRHKLDWTYFKTKREGRAEVIDEDLQIGDEVFEVGDVLETVWESAILKVGWSWSFINVRKYEFQIGAGLNVRDFSLRFENTLRTGGSVTEEKDEEDTSIPLLTFNFGGRFNFTDRVKLDGKYEWFSIELGDLKGSLHELTLLLEHNTFSHIGFGGGFSSFLFDLEYDDEEEFRGEVENRYVGILLYLKVH
jgi:hypothetical protein